MKQHKHISSSQAQPMIRLAVIVLLIMGVGVIAMLFSKALTPTVAVEVESASLNGCAIKVSDSAASGGHAIKFNPPAACVSASFITRSGQKLLLNGQAYRMVGFNMWRANASFTLPNTSYTLNNDTSSPNLSATFKDLNTYNGAVSGKKNTIRTWFLQQQVTPTSSGYNWAPFDHLLQVAAANNIKVIATLADQWDYEGPATRSYQWYKTGYQTDIDRGTSNGISYNENVSYRQYVQDIVNRYKDNPTIAAWELVNEADDADWAGNSSNPTCSSDAGTVMYNFTNDMAGLIKSIDSHHLVSLGVAGNGNCGTSEGDYQTVMGSQYIDLCSFHDYYGAGNVQANETYNGLNVRLKQCATLSKPVYIGEMGIAFGAMTGSTLNDKLTARASATNQKMAYAFSQSGVAGYVVWQWDSRSNAYTNNDDQFNVSTNDPLLQVIDGYSLPQT